MDNHVRGYFYYKNVENNPFDPGFIIQ